MSDAFEEEMASVISVSKEPKKPATGKGSGRGGKRPGAGRPKGTRNPGAGRPKGTRNPDSEDPFGLGPLSNDLLPGLERRSLPGRKADIQGGVTITFLSQLFRMKAATAERRLAKCEVLYWEHNRPVYELRKAAAYLIDPNIDIGTYIRTLRPEELPPKLNKDYWAAERTKQGWFKDAEHIWYTEDVLDVLGEVFKRIKTTVQLFQDNIDRIDSLTDKQRDALSKSCDGLLEDAYSALIELADDDETLNQANQLDGDGMPIPRDPTAEKED